MRPTKAHSAFAVRAAVNRGSTDGGKQQPARSYSVCSSGRSSIQGSGVTHFRPRKPSGTETRRCVGLMMPIYLAPLIIYGTRPSLCLYAILLTLCWWLTSSVPRCVAAFAPVLTLPALQIVSADEAAAYFFASRSLEVTALLVFLTALHTTGTLVPRISFKLCSRFGLQVRPLFVGVACVTYVLALFVHEGVVALLFVMALEKALSCVHESELDRPIMERYKEPDSRDWLPLPLLISVNATPAVEGARTDKLFDQLAKAVVNLNEAEAHRASHQRGGSIVEEDKELWEIEASRAVRRKDTSPSSRRRSTRSRGSRSSRGSIGDKLASVTTTIGAVLRRASIAGRQTAASSGSSRETRTNRLTASESASPRHQDKNATSPRQGPGVMSSPTPMKSPQRHISMAERCASPSLKISVTAPDLPIPDLAGQRSTVDGEQKRPNASPPKLTKTTGLGSPDAFKVAPKDPGVTSPKKHVGKRSSKFTRNSSSKAKLLAENNDAAMNKSSCTSPGQAKDAADAVGAESGNVAVVGPPKVQSPVAKRKDRRTRIDTAEIAVVKITPEGPPRESVRAQQDVASGSGPLSSPSSLTSLGDGQPAVDIRRPSILKVPGTQSKSRVVAMLSAGASHLPDDLMRRPSTVDFGTLECRTLPASPEHSYVNLEPPEPTSAIKPGGPVGKAPPTLTGFEQPSKPTSVVDSRSRRVASPTKGRGFDIGRPVSVSCTNSRPSPGLPRPLTSASAGDRGSYTDVVNIQLAEDKDTIRRKNARNSMRAAFVLCSSLVTVTASLCSAFTIPSKEALFTHRIVKPGPRGFLMWFVLSTPTALLSTVCSCLLLYLQHLRSSDVMQSAEDHRSICTAAAKKLRKLGPVSGIDFLLVCGLAVYALLMLMAPVFHYSVKDNLVVFGGSALMITSAMPWSASDYWNPQHRMVCWSGVARDLPWPVVIVQSAVQLIARIVERNNLLETGFATVGTEFWASNSRLTNQVLFGAVGSVLAEMDDNQSLGPVLMPIVLDIARETRVSPVLYAVPVAMSASSNMILPIRLSLIVAHEVIDVPMTQLALIGVVVKAVIVVTSILSVNTFGGYLISLEPLDRNATIYSNDTYLAFGA
ncbi:uncharacterized protein [Dermacentor albipictus]|uniref:uncharacterized protein isoform X2 n=1 Tax=Dermacentor albipictus TaxID=60249 RepID=UPI0038FC8B41